MPDHPRNRRNPADDARTARIDRAIPEAIHSTPTPTESTPGSTPNTTAADDADPERARRLRRARFLAELAEARELRKRVAPRRTRAAELHARVLRTFRY